MPWYVSQAFANRIALPRPSTTIRNNKGAKGQPCIRPLPDLKKVDATPFISREKYTKERLLITQEMKFPTKPNLESMTRR